MRSKGRGPDTIRKLHPFSLGGYYSAERNGTERTGYVQRALLIISRVFVMDGMARFLC